VDPVVDLLPRATAAGGAISGIKSEAAAGECCRCMSGWWRWRAWRLPTAVAEAVNQRRRRRPPALASKCELPAAPRERSEAALWGRV